VNKKQSDKLWKRRRTTDVEIGKVELQLDVRVVGSPQSIGYDEAENR